MAQVLGIDVGGTGIKAALVDTDTGELLTDRHRLTTPDHSTPANVAATVRKIVAEFDYDGPVGCCFPAVIADGMAKTAGNIHKSWRGTRVDSLFKDATGMPFTVLNDADAAGLAEMAIGVGAEKALGGTVIMITIGTGLGSGFFYEGQLIPNIELGRMPGKDGEPIEYYAGNRARKEGDLDWDEWGARFNYFLERVARVTAPDHFILGGGASKKFDQFRHMINVPTKIHVARFMNNAGIIGAAAAV